MIRKSFKTERITGYILGECIITNTTVIFFSAILGWYLFKIVIPTQRHIVLQLQQIEKDKAYQAGSEITENQQWYQNKGLYYLERKKSSLIVWRQYEQARCEPTSLNCVPETAPEGK